MGGLPGPTGGATPAGGDGGIHGRDLHRESRSIAGMRRRSRRQRTVAAHTEPEGGDRGHEEEGAALRWRWHKRRWRIAPRDTPSISCQPCQRGSVWRISPEGMGRAGSHPPKHRQRDIPNHLQGLL